MKLYVHNLRLSQNVLNAIFPHEDIYYLRVSLVEQELLTFTEHMSSPPVFSGVHVTRSFSFMCIFCRSLFVPLAIVLSVLHRFTDSGYPLWYLQTLLSILEIIQKQIKKDHK